MSWNSVDWMYQPGEYTVTAREGDTDHQHELTLEPETEIVDLRAVERNSEIFLEVVVANEGSGPDIIRDIDVTHDAVDVQLPFGESNSDGNGFQINVNGDRRGDFYTTLPLTVGGERVFETNSPVLGFDVSSQYSDNGTYSDIAELESEWRDEEIDVPVRLGMAGDVLEVTATVRFEGEVVERSRSRGTYFGGTTIVDVSS
ncbi:hypothetical protein [Natronococcus jeotgali]|uniref:Uncharacterized protein n=1 Tax=Natronococcus jeotgali DSM 18795 TaxID=1227498 RepID=L9XE66_9EURY|nr:hypothetical protein [Natronococcus jeotgali]ELY59927.1 hypothetical protein C492_10880 [Natronococcus jeotgali DSM 18795]